MVFCCINKGYFEVVFRKIIGYKIKKTEIKFLENDAENDVRLEELVFYL